MPAANDLVKLVHEIEDADVLIASSLPAEARAAAGSLKLLQFPGAGAQHFKDTDVPAGCTLCNVYEHEVPIAEYVLAVILLHVTQIARYSRTFRSGSWEGNGRTGGQTHDELMGKSIGLIGYGHIGREVAARAAAFGMRVFAIRQTPGPLPAPAEKQLDWLGGPEDLGRLLETADFVVVACPLSERTRNMLGVHELAKMRSASMLINVARAEIIDEHALFTLLSERRIAAAALDVWYRYASSPDEMLHGSKLPLHELPNDTVTPHMAAWTLSMTKRRIQAVARNVDRLARHEPLQCVVLQGSWCAPSS